MFITSKFVYWVCAIAWVLMAFTLLYTCWMVVAMNRGTAEHGLAQAKESQTKILALEKEVGKFPDAQLILDRVLNND